MKIRLWLPKLFVNFSPCRNKE